MAPAMCGWLLWYGALVCCWWGPTSEHQKLERYNPGSPYKCPRASTRSSGHGQSGRFCKCGGIERRQSDCLCVCLYQDKVPEETSRVVCWHSGGLWCEKENSREKTSTLSQQDPLLKGSLSFSSKPAFLRQNSPARCSCFATVIFSSDLSCLWTDTVPLVTAEGA